jgi:hypothetical protein
LKLLPVPCDWRLRVWIVESVLQMQDKDVYKDVYNRSTTDPTLFPETWHGRSSIVLGFTFNKFNSLFVTYEKWPFPPTTSPCGAFYRFNDRLSNQYKSFSPFIRFCKERQRDHFFLLWHDTSKMNIWQFCIKISNEYQHDDFFLLWHFKMNMVRIINIWKVEW